MTNFDWKYKFVGELAAALEARELSAAGLPIGVQIIGPSLEDRTPLKLAGLIESAFGGFVPPPDY